MSNWFLDLYEDARAAIHDQPPAPKVETPPVPLWLYALAVPVGMGLVVAFAPSPVRWLTMFVLALAGSAWCFATAFDDWQGDWTGVWHRSPRRLRNLGVQHGGYRTVRWLEGSDRLAPTYEEYRKGTDRKAPGW